MFPKTQAGRDISSPPLPWVQQHPKPPGRLLWGPQGGKPHSSICPPCRAAGRQALQEQLSGCRSLCLAGNLGQKAAPRLLEQKKAACPQPLSHLQACDRRDSGPDTSFSLYKGAKIGDNSSLPSGNPTGEGAVDLFSGVCFGLQLFLPFLNGSSPNRDALSTSGAPTARKTWISTLESLPFSRF